MNDWDLVISNEIEVVGLIEKAIIEENEKVFAIILIELFLDQVCVKNPRLLKLLKKMNEKFKSELLKETIEKYSIETNV